MIEIERKFLVTSEDFKKESKRSLRITQGYLSSNPERTVRVRLRGESGFLTIKGVSTDDGLSRYEWETEISKTDAEALLRLCEIGIIDKMRYEVLIGNHLFEVDEFFGANSGLIVAEIELKHTAETFLKPNWLGEEVTGNVKYYNSQLCNQPFQHWKK